MAGVARIERLRTAAAPADEYGLRGHMRQVRIRVVAVPYDPRRPPNQTNVSHQLLDVADVLLNEGLLCAVRIDARVHRRGR